jgi:hypothetical protein
MRNFKFFVGISKPTLSVDWVDDNWNDLVGYNTIDAEEEIIRLMSAEISRTIDEDIIRRLTIEINEGLRA